MICIFVRIGPLLLPLRRKNKQSCINSTETAHLEELMTDNMDIYILETFLKFSILRNYVQKLSTHVGACAILLKTWLILISSQSHTFLSALCGIKSNYKRKIGKYWSAYRHRGM